MMDTVTASSPLQSPTIERIKHDLKRRELVVGAVDTVTPQMVRITLTGDSLGDFISASPDDHVKLFLPQAGGEPAMRDYTPRRYDNHAKNLVLDFAVHDAGPATDWALQAKPGMTLTVGGPRGSAVIRGVTRWLLIGDETALPAIGRRIEEASTGDSIVSLAAVADAVEEQVFETAADLRTLWIHRPLSQATDASPLLQALKELEITPDTFVWIAAEGSVARALRKYLREERGHPVEWIKASGYWAKGKADAHEPIND
jgi:NADPH-dependent ferric siderophore reductase